MPLRSLFDRLRWNRRLRWCLAGTCLLLAAASAVQAQTAPGAAERPGATASVVLVRRALTSGHTLTARDVRAAQWPRRLLPAGAVREPRAAVGRRLAGPVLAHELLTTARLVTRALAEAVPPGMSAVTVRVQDGSVASFIQPGDAVDVYAVGADDSGVAADRRVAAVASAAIVVAVLGPSRGRMPDDAGYGDTADTTELLVAVHDRDVGRLVGAVSSGLVAVVPAPP